MVHLGVNVGARGSLSIDDFGVVLRGIANDPQGVVDAPGGSGVGRDAVEDSERDAALILAPVRERRDAELSGGADRIWTPLSLRGAGHRGGPRRPSGRPPHPRRTRATGART